MLTLTPLDLRRRRAIAAFGKPTFTTSRVLDLDGRAELRCEIEFYLDAPAIPASHDDPGAPAEYAISAVRVFDFGRTPAGFMSTERVYLESPAWLDELLIGCIDQDSLADDAAR